MKQGKIRKRDIRETIMATSVVLAIACSVGWDERVGCLNDRVTKERSFTRLIYLLHVRARTEPGA